MDPRSAARLQRRLSQRGRTPLRAKKARQHRRQLRERAEAVARGDVQPERSEQIHALKLKRDMQLAGLSREFTEALNELHAQLAQSKKAIWENFRDAVRSLETTERAADLENLGIIVAPAMTDLDKVAEGLVGATGRPVR